MVAQESSGSGQSAYFRTRVFHRRRSDHVGDIGPPPTIIGGFMQNGRLFAMRRILKTMPRPERSNASVVQ
jgi:hypothetical protein